MPPRNPTDEQLLEVVEAYREANGNKAATARLLNRAISTVKDQLTTAARRGLMGTQPVLPGYEIKKTSTQLGPDGELQREWVQQIPERGGKFEAPTGHAVKGVSALVDQDGNVIQQWVKTREGDIDPIEAVRIAIDELKQDLPPLEPIAPPAHVHTALLNQYTVTDLHFGMLAWGEETGNSDYNLQIAERLLLDWFATAIEIAPKAHTAVLAQLGDLLHYDSMESVTPTSKHVLDADSRIQKIIRVVVRVLRQIVTMLLAAHQHVHILMARANHDPVGGAWLRELLAVLYEAEPRITVETSPDTYYAYQWGETAMFYHHGHKRGLKGAGSGKAVDSVFVGKFREMYGQTRHHYGHTGHLHSDGVVETPLMKLERHRTLAPPDAHAAEGGWLSGRDSKVITYHQTFGEIGRQTIPPAMVQQQQKEAA